MDNKRQRDENGRFLKNHNLGFTQEKQPENNGYKKGVPNAKTRLTKLFAVVMADKDIITKKRDNKTIAEWLDMSMVKKALEGDVKAYEVLTAKQEAESDDKSASAVAKVLPPYFATPCQQEIEQAIETGEYKLITIRKGRRFGFTHWSAIYLVYQMYIGKWDKVLWGDTIVSNILKYFDRYFKPTLDKVVGRDNYTFNRSDKTLKIANLKGIESILDFRSADRPENWEGFGYDAVLLNEAGIILNDPYLYKNAVAPMLLDNSESILIAGGVPKGKTNKKGGKHTFMELCERASERGKAMTFTSYDNPMIAKADIDQLIEDLGGPDSPIVQQEIFGKFVDDFELIFLDRFSDKNISTIEYRQDLDLHLSFDFNIVNTCTLWQFNGTTIACIKEYHIEGYDLQELCTLIMADYPNASFRVNGDCSGKGRSALTMGNVSGYELIREYMDLAYSDFSDKLASVNPSHKASRLFCNIIIKQDQYPILIDESCTGLIRDCKQVRFESKRGKMSIVKSDETLTHWLDTMRYYLHQEHEWLMNELGVSADINE